VILLVMWRAAPIGVGDLRRWSGSAGGLHWICKSFHSGWSIWPYTGRI